MLTAATTRFPIGSSPQQFCRIDPTKLLSSACCLRKTDNAIVNFPGLDQFGLTFDRNRDHRLRQISIAELVGPRVSANELSATPSSGEATAMMAGPGVAGVPDTFGYFTQYYAALPPKFEARHANSYKCWHERHRGSSQRDLEGVCQVERSTGRARSHTGCYDGATRLCGDKSHRSVQSVRGRSPGGKEADCDQDHSQPTMRLSRRTTPKR